MKKQKTKKNPHKLILLLIIWQFCSLALPSKAFIPYIYEPSKQELKRTGISIGKTAAQLLQLGQPKEAARLASLAVRIQPNDYRFWAILAEAQLQLRQQKNALYSLSKAKELNPKQASLWFAEASLAIQNQQTKHALYLLKMGLSLDPNNAGGYFQLGNARIINNELNLALKSYEKALNINPKFWEAYNNKGIVLFEMGKTLQAIRAWRNVLEIEKNAEPILALASALYQLQEENTEARSLAIEALAKNPNYVSSKYQEKHLWGKRLRSACKKLLSMPELEASVAKALANAELNDE